TSERKILGTTTPSVALPGNAGSADLSRFARIAMRMDLDPVLPAPTTAGISNVAQPPPKLPPTSNANISPRRTERFQLHMDRAAQFLASGDLDDSRRSFLEALLLSPGDAAAHSGLAEVYWHQERPDDAVREFRLALTSRNDASTRT